MSGNAVKVAEFKALTRKEQLARADAALSNIVGNLTASDDAWGQYVWAAKRARERGQVT